jgi:hypothetical protein
MLWSRRAQCSVRDHKIIPYVTIRFSRSCRYFKKYCSCKILIPLSGKYVASVESQKKKLFITILEVWIRIHWIGLQCFKWNLFWIQSLWQKIRKMHFFFFWWKNGYLLIPRPLLRTSKLQEKPSGLKRKQSSLPKIKFINFFQLFWVIFALLDQVPDPQHC